MTKTTKQKLEYSKEKKREYKKQYYKNISEGKKKKRKNEEFSIEKYEKMLEDDRIRQIKLNIKTRIIVICHYSNNNPKCVCCGDKKINNLVLDHINGGGNKHRRESGKNWGIAFYRLLIKNDFPPEYQVLCWYCNLRKGPKKLCPCKEEKKIIKKIMKELNIKIYTI